MQARGGNRNAALLGALVIAAVAVAALVLLFGGAPRPAQPPKPPTLVANPQSASPDASESPHDTEVGRTADETTTHSPSAPVSSGALHLHFVSALDGSPVADLPFLVYRERGGNKELARGSSDAQGRAEVRDLEENVILVATPRRPPFANHVEACWLGHGETKELAVRLDSGARVVGRALDEAKQPIEGIGILVAADSLGLSMSNPLDRSDPSTVTGPDGRFTVDHVADTPSGVWMVDGEARPEHWMPAFLHLRDACSASLVTADVKPGTTLDLGDIVLERCANLAGVVLDSDGLPLPGALVSLQFARRYARRYGEGRVDSQSPTLLIAPGQAGFHLHAGEILTDARGRFALRASPKDADLAVWAPSGQRQVFETPKHSSGERCEDLVLKLDAVTLLEIELRDARGNGVTGPGPAAREKGLFVHWRKGRRMIGTRATVSVRLDDGTREEVAAAADADGLFRFESKTAPSRMRDLELDLAGYGLVHDRIEGRVESLTRLAYVLQEMPGLRLRLDRAPGTPQEDAKLNLNVQICLASPEQRNDLPPGGAPWNCCGLGASVAFEWLGEPREFVLPVIEPRAYWTYLRGYVEEKGVVDLASFGPFEAGETLHEIEADPTALRKRLARDPRDLRAPPAKSAPGKNGRGAQLTLRLVDSKTDEPIQDGWANGEETRASANAEFFPHLEAGRDGRIDHARVPAGSWTIVVGAKGCRKHEIPDVVLLEGEAMDLGAVALERRPEFRGRLLQADGEPAPVETWIRATGAETPSIQDSALATTDGDGRFRLAAELPERVLLEAVEPASPSLENARGAQRFIVEGWTPGEEKVISLAPWQRVEVLVGGPAVDPPGTTLYLWACPAPGEPTASCDHRGTVSEPHASLLGSREVDATSTRRVFRFRMAAGRYQVYGRDLLHEVPAQEIQVRASSEVQVFDLSSR